MHNRIVAVAVLAAVAVTSSACTSASGGHATRTGAGSVTSTPPSRSATEPTAVLVPASQNPDVEVLPLAASYRGTSGFSLQPDTAPDPMRLGRPNTVHFVFYNDDPQKAELGLTGIATNGALACGSPFAAPPGHGYRLTCSFTPSATKGIIGASYADAATGQAKGTRVSVPFTAR